MPRPEITGRKIATAPAPHAFSVKEFCAAYGVGETLYYRMRKEGWGPTEMVVGRRRLISFESAARWRAEREAAQDTA